MIPTAFVDVQQAFSGKLFASPKTYRYFLSANSGKTPVYVRVCNYVFVLDEGKQYQDNQVAFN